MKIWVSHDFGKSFHSGKLNDQDSHGHHGHLNFTNFSEKARSMIASGVNQRVKSIPPTLEYPDLQTFIFLSGDIDGCCLG